MKRTFARGRSVGTGWQTTFWLATFIAFAMLLWLFSAVLPPFVAALLLGYLLDPVVGRIQRFGIGRAWGATIIMLSAFVLLIVVTVLVAPMVWRQFADLIRALPDLFSRAQSLASSIGDQLTHGHIGVWLRSVGLDDSVASELRGQAGELANKAAQWLAGFANSLLYRSAALLDILSWLVVTPVVALYLLLDWQVMIKTIDGLVPPRHRDTVWGLAHEIDLALSGFLRGQSLVCLFLAVWYGLGLSLIGLNFGLLIGLTGGIISFIPYLGSLFVLLVSALIAVVQGWPNWHLPALAVGIVLVGQFLEGNVLSPKLVGDKVGLHPVWVIFALLAFGSVFGFIGLVLAVPVAAAAGVMLRFASRRYRDSPFYAGDAPPSPVIVAEGPGQRGAA